MKKKIVLLILAAAVAAMFCACTPAEPISTDLGEFHYKQEFTPTLGDDAAAEGNTFLVVYLTPADGTEVTEDEAGEFFYNDTTQAVVDDVSYNLYCLAYEQVNGQSVRFGLVFEVEDKGYEEAKEQPVVKLKLS